MANTETQSILVIGGGMSGLTAAIEAAEAGHDTYLIERNPYLGGRVAQFYHYFPKLCPPYCGLEMNFRRMKQNPKIRFFTMAEVEKISGQEGNFDVTIRLNPRYVNENCTGCGKCADVCTQEIDNPFNYGMNKMKAAYLPHDMAFPMRYVLDPSIVNTGEGQKAKEACPYHAIELDMKPKTLELKVGAVVWATGWQPYDAKKLDSYGFGQLPDVITNVMMERMAAWSGPTQGKILCPSTGQAPKTVAFVQCAGSRDQNHLAFCSGVCCLASMKQATYVREQYPDAQIYIFFIDIRATGQLEDFYTKSKKDDKLNFFKGKVAKVTKAASGPGLVLRVEETTRQELHEITADLVVLATGMQPNTPQITLPTPLACDDYGFISAKGSQPGMYAAGCIKAPNGVSDSVQDATAAALKAIQSITRR